MADYYCKRCDRMTGSFHRCFIQGYRAYRKKPNPNTPLARKLAKKYEDISGREFPGGVENARVQRLAQMGYASSGAWKWCLEQIEISGLCPGFGSQDRATDCAKEEIEYFHPQGSGYEIWTKSK